MKKMQLRQFFPAIMLTIVAIVGAQAQSLPEAEKAYNEGNYSEAAKLYEEALANGESAQLYYNLGNTCFKMDKIALSILNYERALLLEPGDEDIRINLEMAKGKIVNKVTPIERFFLIKWFADMQNLQSSNSWAKLSISFFIALLGCLFLFFFGRKIILRKTGFYAGLLLIVGIFFSIVFAGKQKHRLTEREYAILTEPSITVKSSPNPDGKELFIVHEGVKVRIKNAQSQWYEVELEDGSVGWVPQQMAERI